jgi:HK97 family phage portal protein
VILERIKKIFAGSIEDPNVPLGWEAISHAIESRGGGPSEAGIVISEDTAMRFGAVFACVRVIAGTLGSLPLNVYKRRKSGGQDLATDNRAYPILHDRPNPQMSSMVWREAVEANTLLTGAGYSEIQYDNAGRFVGAWPLRSSLTSPVRDEKGFRFVTYDTPDGSERAIQPEDMIYIPGLSFNGVVGLSVVGYARNAIGLGLAAEKFGSKLFSNGARLSGVLMYPQKLTENSRKNLQDSFNLAYQGADNAHKTIVLEENAKYLATSIPPEDAQFLETRKYQRSEICGWFGVPAHMINDLEHSTFSNIEQQDLDFAKHCMRPRLVRYEQELNYKLFRNTDFFCEFDLDDLQRGDFLSRQLGLQIQRQNGIIDTNEWRADEKKNPVPEKDNVIIVPLNFTTPEKMQEPTPTPAAPQLGDGNKEDGTQQKPNPEETKKQKRNACLTAKPVFTDAIRRILKRPADKRTESDTQTTLTPSLLVISGIIQSKATGNFLGEYCAALAIRAKEWTADQAEAITDSEFTRALEALESQ